MEDNKEKTAPWLSVPQFGDWDQKGALPDYSLDFSKIRENRKQNKRDLSRVSLGNEEELVSSTTSNANTGRSAHNNDQNYHKNQSPTTRRSIFSYFNCCVKA
ncbi:uncharacterized protein LOC107818992 [Nicotiana tabacum]|uniref:Uncharacterized protein LOC107818992 n=2 Tax=Nicotiana TaxID=4085 RepID=A0A1S4CHS7_TOBAC|nr:PREDICTED: uncharacterized protein LOC104214960 [Nicotiana sylvestris]XP_016500564.1 PREDICTED: uncharacterized protein LOC107818992 isoform X2 [Nicotiana tabacum]